MSRRRFKSYKRKSRSPRSRRSGRRSNNRKLMILALLVIVAGVFFIKWLMRDDETAVTDNDNDLITDINAGQDEGQPDEEETTDIVVPPVQPEPEKVTPEPADPAPVATNDNVGTEAEMASPEALQLISEATEDINAGRMIAGRDKLNDVLKPQYQLSSSHRIKIKAQMAKLAEKWLFSTDSLPEDTLTDYYDVQSGERLENIGKAQKVPYQILMEINNISRPELLRAGKSIKVINGPFNAIIYRSTFKMDLYLQETFVKSYDVGLGRPGHETPLGLWRVKPGGKSDRRPIWTDPDTGKTYEGADPDYPLGDRWIGIEGMDDKTKERTGFALHGTKDPTSIGQRSSRGCIRLHNDDVIEVYNLLASGHSQVIIVE